jgi:hypothetical protein
MNMDALVIVLLFLLGGTVLVGSTLPMLLL